MMIPIYKPGDILVNKSLMNDQKGRVLVLGSEICSETETYFTDGSSFGSVTAHYIKTNEWVKYSLLVSNSFEVITSDESDLVCNYRRVGHMDLLRYFKESDAEAKNKEKDEEIRKAKEAIEFYKDQLRDRRKDIRVLQDKVEEFKADDLDMRKQISMLKDDNSKLVSKNERLVIRQQELEQCAEVGAAYDKAIATGKINSLIDTVQSLKKENDKLRKEVAYLNDQLRIAYGCIDRFTIDAVAGMHRAGCSVEKIAKTLNMPEQVVKVYLNAADVLDCKEEE